MIQVRYIRKQSKHILYVGYFFLEATGTSNSKVNIRQGYTNVCAKYMNALFGEFVCTFFPGHILYMKYSFWQM